MATKLIVEVCSIEKVTEHPNASSLALAQIKGWQVVIPLVEDPNGSIARFFIMGARDEKGKRIPWVQPESDSLPMAPREEVRFSPAYKEGDLVVYFPMDTLVPFKWLDKFGASSYCGLYKDNPELGRVKCAKLRGEPSYGLVVPVPDPSWEEGRDVAEYYGCIKYEPPVRTFMGDAEKPDSVFITYTDIENLRNYNRVLAEGEEVVIVEKCHGTNSRQAKIIADEPDENGVIHEVIRTLAGSNSMQRRDPGVDLRATSTYWFPWTKESVNKLMDYLAKELRIRVSILFGEVYGASIQKLGGTSFKYDAGSGLGYRAFDLFTDGKFLDYDDFETMCSKFSVPIMPVLYRGPFSMDIVKRLASGKSTFAEHIREGVVVRPVKERRDRKLGRVILKYIGDEYLILKGAGKIPDYKEE